MKAEDFAFIRDLVKARTGTVLVEDKAYLLESRLLPLVRRRGLKNLGDLIETVRVQKAEPLFKDVTEAIIAGDSVFFRDSKAFDHFRAITLPHLLTRGERSRPLRIWCAGASSGQEPYTVAMILREENARVADRAFEIVATDIATESLERARAGLYSQFDIQRGLPIRLLVKYFDKDGDRWQIKPDLRAMVQHLEHNLLDPLEALGRFDVIFCRNVLQDFERATRVTILAGIADLMLPGATLFLGGTEKIERLSGRFKPVARMPGAYRLVGDESPAP